MVDELADTRIEQWIILRDAKALVIATSFLVELVPGFALGQEVAEAALCLEDRPVTVVVLVRVIDLFDVEYGATVPATRIEK